MIFIAKLSENTIIDHHYKFGIAFNSLKAHDLNEVLYLEHGWELVLDSKSQYIILRGKSLQKEQKILFSTCYDIVQRGLDILSVNGKGDLSISDGLDEYIIWWKEKDKQFLKIVTVTDYQMGVSVETTITDSEGNTIEQDIERPTKYHKSLRYYRLSQITEDLFDSFRNMYLAFESLLSLQTKRRKGEREGDWLKRGLNNIDSLKTLENLFDNSGHGVVEKFYKQIYLDVRCSLFHAKENSRKLVPQNLEDRKRVAKALEILTHIVLLLSKKLLNINRETAVITNVGFSNLFRDSSQAYKILLSDSEKPLSELESASDPIHQAAFIFEAIFSEELSVPGLNYFVGTISPSNIVNVPIINRFSLQINDVLFSIHNIHKGLTLENVD
ncbi:hypothetical protein P4661_29795, partial [Priestia megaterium]|uniref:methylamine utilization protein MauJ n=1 Tax=Priestia megaterium TaxID=1404 RepID=UPI002E2181AA|nr:hypothetical protein [Priestia megaterium]